MFPPRVASSTFDVAAGTVDPVASSNPAMSVRGGAAGFFGVVGAVALVAVATACGDTATGDTTATTTPASTPVTSNPSPPTSSPSTTAPEPWVGDGRSVVYTVSGDPTDPDGVQTIVDPVTGAVVGSEPIDPERARRAQAALPGGTRSTVDLGDVAYEFDQVFYDSGTLDTEIYPDVDLCGQNVVTVRSDAGSVLPARAHVVSVSPDDRYVVTLSSTCPETGTMGADGIGTTLPFDATFEVFDARRPDLPARTLLAGVTALNVGRATYSGNGRFVALETYDGDQPYRVFDLESGGEVDVADGCSVSGTNHSRFAGPWIGRSSIALLLDCADGQRLVVRDLMPGGDELIVPVPAVDPSAAPTAGVRAEVDRVGFDTPATASFVLCDTMRRTCWVGQGSDPTVELTDVSDASFLPLGYSPGG